LGQLWAELRRSSVCQCTQRHARLLGREATNLRLGLDVRVQRKPKYPNMNKTITTAPTSQMILFMIRFLWAETAEALWFERWLL